MGDIKYGVQEDLDGDGLLGLTATRDGIPTTEWYKCQINHTAHTQACALALLDAPSKYQGKTITQHLNMFFEVRDAAAARPVHTLTLPTRKVSKEITETVKDDSGKDVEITRTVMVDEAVTELR